MRTVVAFAVALLTAAGSVAQESAQGRKYALLVGVNKYDDPDLAALKYAENDVTRFRDVLTAAGFRRVVLLTETERSTAKEKTLAPTRGNIRAHLADLLKGCQPADLVIVGFAGHGLQPLGATGLHFCPEDAKLADPRSFLPLAEVYEALKACPAGTKLLIADACRNEPLSGRSALIYDPKSLTRPPVPPPPAGVVSLFGCSPGQKAFESDKHKHGFLFHTLIEGLQGKAASPDGAVYVVDLVSYALRELPDAVKDEYKSFQVVQTPEFTGTVRGRPVLFNAATAVAVKATPPNPAGSPPKVAADDRSAANAPAPTSEPDLTGTKFAHFLGPDAVRVLVRRKDMNECWVLNPTAGNSVAGPFAHEEDVESHPVFSPDGQLVAAIRGERPGDRYYRVYVWGAATGDQVQAFHTGEVRPHHVAFRPDGKRFVAATSRDAEVADSAAENANRKTLPHDRNEVLIAVFSPDGQKIVTVSRYGKGRVWDAATGQPVTEPLPHRIEHHRHWDTTCCAAFSPDGRRVVTGGDSLAKVWDAATGQRLVTLRHGGDVMHVAFSPDGRKVVTASRDDAARVWDASTGKLLTGLLEHSSWVQYAAFSPDGRRVVTASDDRTARVWDATTGQPVTKPMRHDAAVSHAAFGPDGRKVVTASDDATARLWDAATGDLIGTAKAPPFQPDKKDDN